MNRTISACIQTLLHQPGIQFKVEAQKYLTETMPGYMTTSSNTLQPQGAANIGNMCAAIDSIAEDFKQKLQEDNEQPVFGAEKFIFRCNKYSLHHC